MLATGCSPLVGETDSKWQAASKRIFFSFFVHLFCALIFGSFFEPTHLFTLPASMLSRGENRGNNRLLMTSVIPLAKKRLRGRISFGESHLESSSLCRRLLDIQTVRSVCCSTVRWSIAAIKRQRRKAAFRVAVSPN